MVFFGDNSAALVKAFAVSFILPSFFNVRPFKNYASDKFGFALVEFSNASKDSFNR